MWEANSKLERNAGIGYNMGNGFEVRGELPILAFDGGDAGFVLSPTVTATAGYRL